MTIWRCHTAAGSRENFFYIEAGDEFSAAQKFSIIINGHPKGEPQFLYNTVKGKCFVLSNGNMQMTLFIETYSPKLFV